MKSLLIVGDSCPTDEMLDRARGHALRAYRLVCTGWRVLVADGHGIDAHVARTCATWGIELLVCGVAKQPRNGTPATYYRRVETHSSGWKSRYAERDAYLLALADQVICIGVSQPTRAYYEAALLAGKIAYLTSGQRQAERRRDEPSVAGRA